MPNGARFDACHRPLSKGKQLFISNGSSYMMNTWCSKFEPKSIVRLVELYLGGITLNKFTEINTVESRFLEPPTETKIDSKSWEFEISGVKLQ